MTTTLSKAILLTSVLTLSACVSVDTTGNGDSSSSASIAQSSSSSESHQMIEVTFPHANGLVDSPLTVTGRARGNWYFEASFPVKVLDATGKQIAIEPAQAQGDWMTTEFVPFSVMLEFDKPMTPTGTIVLEKDNPSGMPENDDSITIPVRFQ